MGPAQAQGLLGAAAAEKAVEQARREAYDLMAEHAATLGANGVIGVRYDATELSAGITEVLCYGTAVYVERAG